MSNSKLLLNKSMVVTGAGGGIGRTIALAAAEAGAKVVVNELNAEAAEKVVAEIKAKGGEAVACAASVASWEGGQEIVQAAVDNFGRIDAVVNNAGILRDVIFHKMTPEDFEAVIGVHLMGSFYVSRAAAPYFRAQESGAMVHMTSTAGLIGNFGQANYASAKLGMVALSKSIALDMARYNVRSNCIAPFAWSQMTASIPTETDAERERVERIKKMTPEKVAVMAVALCSDRASDVSGQIFAVRQNEIFLMGQSRPIRSAHTADGWTPETILDRVMPAFKPDFYDLVRSGDVFCWDPM